MAPSYTIVSNKTLHGTEVYFLYYKIITPKIFRLASQQYKFIRFLLEIAVLRRAFLMAR